MKLTNKRFGHHREEYQIAKNLCTWGHDVFGARFRLFGGRSRFLSNSIFGLRFRRHTAQKR
jgi:hypothetical protein